MIYLHRNVFSVYINTLFYIILCAFIIFSFCVYSFYFQDSKQALSNSQSKKDYIIVIDAGHGGEDGGAVGVSGKLEKDINLSIARKLKVFLDLSGYEVVMTRNDDKLLYKEGQESRKKFNDLNNRKEIVNSIENAILVSIHQNKFPIEKYNGLQVYYSPNDEASETLANLIQDNTKDFLQNDNNRETKQAGKNIFILKNVTCPAVLVECGFLSNRKEEANLCNSDYQKTLAYIIFLSLTEFINS